MDMAAITAPRDHRAPTDDGAPALGSERGRPAGMLLLEADPGLAYGIDPAELRAVAPLLRVRRLDLTAGPWAPQVPPEDAEGFGYLLRDGFLLRELEIDGRSCAELLGPGDLLRPWSAAGEPGASVEAVSAFRVLGPAHAVVLDRRVSAVIGRVPGLVTELLDRTLARARTLHLQLALTQVRGVDQRLLLLLWHLADRWGRVTPDGVVVTVDLTHEMLARMVGARRPSVSSGLCRMARDGALLRRDAEWVLRPSHRPCAFPA